jgi:O-antigen/teichoic acid export membrane protein
VYLQHLHAFPTPGRFQFDVFKGLVKTGFPIVLFNLIFEFLRTADRFVVFFLLGEEPMGYYGVAVMILGLALSIPAVSREVIEPKLMENLDRATPAENVEHFVTRPLMNTAYLMPFVIGPSILLLPVIIPLLLPDYAPGIEAAQVLLIGSFFLATTHAMRGIIVAYQLQLKAAILAFMLLMLNITLSLVAVQLGYGILGVAVASSLSFFLIFAVLLAFVWWQIRHLAHGLSLKLGWFFLPFLVMCLLLYVGDHLIGQPSVATSHQVLVQLALFLIVQGALLLVVCQSGRVRFRVETP